MDDEDLALAEKRSAVLVQSAGESDEDISQDDAEDVSNVALRKRRGRDKSKRAYSFSVHICSFFCHFFFSECRFYPSYSSFKFLFDSSSCVASNPLCLIWSSNVNRRS